MRTPGPKDSQPLLRMSSKAFEEFYAQTARPLKSYLLRLLRNEALADEALQDAYYKYLRGAPVGLEEKERKNYLFRIATNLVNDLYRGRSEAMGPLPETGLCLEADSGTSADVRKVLAELKPRERELAWLAYAEGSSHREIAGILGVQEASVRPMLFRVRQRLASLLRAVGYHERTVV